VVAITQEERNEKKKESVVNDIIKKKAGKLDFAFLNSVLPFF
jgi:hypothetical protein